MTPQRERLVNYRKFDTPEKVGLGDGRIVEAEGVGNVHLNICSSRSVTPNEQ